MRIIFTDRALQDLESIRAYISRDNPVAAAEQVERIFSRISGLAVHPLSGRPGRISGTRELVVSGTRHIAAYIAEGETVKILAIIHGAMMWPEEM